MVAKKKKTRQQNRQAAHEATKKPEPGKPPMVKMELTPGEVKMIVGALIELPMKIALPLVNKMQFALQNTLTVKPEGKH